MKTKTPKEYITLQAGPDKNYARFERSRLLNYESCNGKSNPYPKLTEKYWGISRLVLKLSLWNTCVEIDNKMTENIKNVQVKIEQFI